MGIVSVLVDSREPEWLQNLTFGDCPVVVTMLDAGDIYAACDDGHIIVVERKTANDFLGTLRDDRLFPQMLKIREASQWAYLAICGNLTPGANGKCLCDGCETGWNWSSVSGALLSVQEMGVNVLWVASDNDFESAIIRLGNRDRSGLRIMPPRDVTIVGTGEMILASLPGIGADRVKGLLEHCGTPAAAITYLTSDDKHDIPGIGYQTKQKVRKALGLRWDEALELTVREKNENGELKQIAMKEIARGRVA